jgi:hypothetical protein
MRFSWFGALALVAGLGSACGDDTDTSTTSTTGTGGAGGSTSSTTTTSGGGSGGAGGAGGSGGAGGGGGGGGAGPSANVAFVSSKSYGLAENAPNADTICAELASQAGLPPGTYVAWLSTATRSAAEALGTASGWVRVDGLPFAASADDLLASRILNPLRLDELGADVGQQQSVATGSLPDGSPASDRCDDWTSSSPNSFHFVGDPAAGGVQWAARFQRGCDASARFYCLQVDHDAPLEPPPPPSNARLVFTTTTSLLGNEGIGTADGLCVAEALAAGLPGTYQALLATDTKSAASRVGADDRPWYRPDGVRVADVGALVGMAFDDLLATPNVGADGTTHVFDRVWSGDSAPGNAPGNNLTCGSWTTDQGAAVAGENGPSDGTWFSGVLTSCADTENRVRCFQN